MRRWLALLPLVAACGGSDGASSPPPSGASAAGSAGDGSGAGGGTGATGGSATAGAAGMAPKCPVVPVAPPMLVGDGTPEEQAVRRYLDALARATGDIRTDARAACAKLVGLLGCGVVTSGGSATAADVDMACNAAVDCLGKQGTLVPTMISGGKCEASLGLAVECDTGCGTEEPCHTICVDAAKALSFCVEPKLTQADPKVSDALKASLPLLHKAGEQQAVLVAEAADAHADLVTLALASEDPCVVALGQAAKTGVESLPVVEAASKKVLGAAGIASPLGAVFLG